MTLASKDEITVDVIAEWLRIHHAAMSVNSFVWPGTETDPETGV
jgi:hypothetical protein